MQFLDPRLPDRFWSKCIPEPNSGCWLWFAHIVDGYGHFQIGSRKDGTRRKILAHRLTYQTAIGSVPDGLELDHAVCRTRSCCNPWHLEAVTHLVNVRRGMGGSYWRNKTHCPAGHPYDEANTYYCRRGRRCRACSRIRMREVRSRR